MFCCYRLVLLKEFTIMISFFFSSNVPLPFEWIFYNPRTELRGSDDSTEVTPPIPLTDQSSPFTVNTPNGTLLPREAKPFTFSFLPIEVHACMYIALSVIILHACSQICENQIDYRYVPGQTAIGGGVHYMCFFMCNFQC